MDMEPDCEVVSIHAAGSAVGETSLEVAETAIVPTMLSKENAVDSSGASSAMDETRLVPAQAAAMEKKGQKLSKKNGSKCPGCAKYLPPSAFGLCSKFCYGCKIVKDRLYKAAQKSGTCGWLSEQLAAGDAA
eukprot:3909560-Amphidinium_carterae.1